MIVSAAGTARLCLRSGARRIGSVGVRAHAERQWRVLDRASAARLSVGEAILSPWEPRMSESLPSSHGSGGNPSWQMQWH